MRVTLNWFIQT